MVESLRPHQHIINTDKEIIFQSYRTIMFIYYKNKNKIVFNTDEGNYTKTTCRYIGSGLEKVCEFTDWKYKNLNDLTLNSKNRKKDILNLKDGILKLC